MGFCLILDVWCKHLVNLNLACFYVCERESEFGVCLGIIKAIIAMHWSITYEITLGNIGRGYFVRLFSNCLLKLRKSCWFKQCRGAIVRREQIYVVFQTQGSYHWRKFSAMKGFMRMSDLAWTWKKLFSIKSNTQGRQICVNVVIRYQLLYPATKVKRCLDILRKGFYHLP